MRLLFDTHTFIWWVSEPERLPVAVRVACEEPTNDLVLSVVSLWEIQIKYQLGKLALIEPLAKTVHDQTANGVSLLPVELAHVLALDTLPPIHKDPFDRLLVAQANTESASLLSGDNMIRF
jgi:PIN domain nuclease of toxin-antitoxin system